MDFFGIHAVNTIKIIEKVEAKEKEESRSKNDVKREKHALLVRFIKYFKD